MELNKLKVAGITIAGCNAVFVFLVVLIVKDTSDAITLIISIGATSVGTCLILAYIDIYKEIKE